jgi:hypothetical protein
MKAIFMSCALLAAAQAARADDDLNSGVLTAEALDERPPAFRVSWIKWDSAFRQGGLQIGDRIVAVDGRRVEKPAQLEELQKMLPKAIGQYAESQTWSERGAREGQRVALTVRRRAASGEGVQELQINGAVHADRPHEFAGRRALSATGPQEMENDGLGDAWTAWYDRQVAFAQKVLDGGWQQRSFNNRVMLQDHLAEKERLDFLVKRYPGPFAAAVQADWQRVLASLLGQLYQLDDKSLAWRRLDEERAAEVTATAKRARAAFLQSKLKETIAPFPAIDPIRGDRKKVVGKIVVLPALANRDWISEGGHAWMVSGDRKRGHYFIDTWAAPMMRLLDVRFRYRTQVSPQLNETYAVIGRVKPAPRMLVIGGRAATGLEVEPIAATIGEQVFVDLTVVKDKASPFAGEEKLSGAGGALPPPEAKPRQVMEAFISALKLGQEQVWKKLFATWRAERWNDTNETIYHPFYEVDTGSEWIESRRRMADNVFDVRVVYVSEPRPVLTGAEFKSAPRIEEVFVEVDHVGKFEKEYRPFVDITVHRIWFLQRVAGGPWRISSVQGI